MIWRMSNTGSPNRLLFHPEPIEYFLKSIVAGLSLLIYVPAAQKITELAKYVTQKLNFEDGTTVTYEGTPATIQQAVLPMTIVIWVQIILNALIDDGILQIGVSVAMSIATAYVAFQLLVLMAGQLVTNHGSRLKFSGTLEEYLKWQLLIVACTSGPSLLALLLLPKSGFLAGLAAFGLAMVGLVLFVCVFLAYMKWVGSKLTGGARVGHFEANPVEMIGVFVGFLVFSIFIVTIPWSITWYAKWLLGRYSLPARSAMAASGYSV
ncbi:MAG: hypothetical protein K2Q23_14020 [Bryobacteraceae bacterium]|nr:hypothetical protein [Bryobacteraceae bacterium]